MQPALMTTGYISVTRNGASVQGNVLLLNEEAGAGGNFVSKVRFVPNVPFKTTDEVILTVKREVKSYANIEMAADFIQRIEIQKELTSITVPPVLNLALHNKAFINVLVEPQAAAAGKKITARSISSSIASVSPTAVLNAAGKAALEVTGELSGSTVIYVSIDETDIKAEITVHVAMPESREQVIKPIASIPSGSMIDKNTTVTLSSNTAGATIYYTLDGTTPSAASGVKYTQAIVITDHVTIRAIAVKEGMWDSEIAIFDYYLTTTGLSDEKNEQQSRMIISPNPVRVGESCKVTFNMPDDELKDCYIVIYSVLGEKVYENHRLSPVMEIRGLRAGYYITLLSNTNNRIHQTRKFIVIN